MISMSNGLVLAACALGFVACRDIGHAQPESASPAVVSDTAPVATASADRIFRIPPIEIPVQFEQSSGQTVLKQCLQLMNVSQARSDFSVTGAGLTAAVLDTGLRTTHVDFRGRVVAQRNWTPDNGGVATNALDGQGHGTNVAGIIAASDEGATLPRGQHKGVAPGAGIVPLKVLSNTGSGSFEWVEQALKWVLDHADEHKISVVNLSLGDGENYASAPAAADTIRKHVSDLRAKRIPVVVAAGNDYYGHKAEGMAYPANIPETTSVAAVYDANIGPMTYAGGAQAVSTATDRITPFSQRLHETSSATLRTDLLAPGAAVTSSGIADDDGESVQQGTSQAAPMVAGVILLIQEYYQRIKHERPTVDDLERWMRAGSVSIVDDCNQCDNVPHTKKTFPRLDALRALKAVKAEIAP